MFRHIIVQIRCEEKCVNGPENENIMQYDFLFYFLVLRSLKPACFCEIYAKSQCNSKKLIMMEMQKNDVQCINTLIQYHNCKLLLILFSRLCLALQIRTFSQIKEFIYILKLISTFNLYFLCFVVGVGSVLQVSAVFCSFFNKRYLVWSVCRAG